MSQPSQDDRTLARELAQLEMLAQDSSPAAFRRLRVALRHSLPVIRQVAATSMGRSRNPAAIPFLVDAVHDQATDVRRSAIWALGQIGDPRVMDALQEALRDPEGDVRRAAVWALGRLERGRESPSLAAAQWDEDILVRRSAGAVMTGAAPPPATIPYKTRKSGRGRRSTLLWLGVIGISTAICIAVAAIRWQQPLGPDLVMMEDGSQPGEEPVSSRPENQVAPQCGGPPVMMLLIVGLDSEGYYRGFADVIRVARIDFVSPGVILLGIPRDLWVTIPGQEEFGIHEERVKMAYPYGNVNKVPGGGPSLLAQTLKFNLGLQVTHYAATDFASFEATIDQIGGVDIYLPQDVGNAETDPPYFPAGWTHMDGATALRYARTRPDNSSDLTRMDRQNELIKAMRAKVTSSEFLPHVPALISQMQGSMATDLSPSDISSLLCIAEKVQPEQTAIVRIDKPLVLSVTDEYGYERLLADQDTLRGFVQAFELGDLETLRQIAKP